MDIDRVVHLPSLLPGMKCSFAMHALVLDSALWYSN